MGDGPLIGHAPIPGYDHPAQPPQSPTPSVGVGPPAMRAVRTDSEAYDFSFSDIDTRVRVQTRDGEVTIRATRDSFTLKRKEYFIHELAAEGFIPDVYGWFSMDAGGSGRMGVRWVVDDAWPGTAPEEKAASNLVLLGLLSGSALLLALTLCVLFAGRPEATVSSPAGAPSTHSR